MVETRIISDSTLQTIELGGKTTTSIQVKQGIKALLYFKLINDSQTHLTLDIEKDAEVTMLLWNESTASVLDCIVNLSRNARVVANLGEMSDGAVEAKIVFNLFGEGSYANIRSACIADTLKHFDLQCIHHAPHTIGIMENYAVVRANGIYKMVDTGKIVKGSYGSESHQTTRVLTMAEKQASEVTPLLLIDENDVAASHATTLGQPDENQLYYLQTRGLSREQALGLIMIGYLLPVAKGLNDEMIEKELTQKIEAKAGISCLM